MTIDLDRLARTVQERVPGIEIRRSTDATWLIYDSDTAYASIAVTQRGYLDIHHVVSDPIVRVMLRAVLDALDEQERASAAHHHVAPIETDTTG